MQPLLSAAAAVRTAASSVQHDYTYQPQSYAFPLVGKQQVH